MNETETGMIERLREATNLNARRPGSGPGPVTCPRALASPPPQHWCRHVRNGHRCRYSNPPGPDGVRHRGHQHECACRMRWENLP